MKFTQRLMLGGLCGLLLLAGVFGVAVEAGAAPQALVCTTMVDVQSCTGGHYTTHPNAGDYVRKGTDWNDFTVSTFGALAPSDPFQVCIDSGVSEGATFPWPFDQWTDPCHQWGILPASAFASAEPVQATMTIAWDLPLTNTDGTALTGPAALNAIELFVATSHISSTPVGSPTVTVGPILNTSTVFNGTYAVGTTVYVRVRVRNMAGGMSALSNEITKVIEVPVATPPAAVPGMPVNVHLTISIVPTH